MTPPRDRHPFGWAAVVVALVLVAVLYVGLLVRWPVAGAWVTSNLLAALVASWATGRNLRAELEAARYRLVTYNGSETHEALAEVGPVTGPTNVVELYDQDALAEMREQAESVGANQRDGLSRSIDERWDAAVALTDCPEAGGCRRPEQCETGCHWRRLDALNRSLVDDDPASTLPRSLPGRER